MTVGVMTVAIVTRLNHMFNNISAIKPKAGSNSLTPPRVG